jgi:hypothetical protein
MPQKNYRSVTFADISIFNPAFIIDPNIKDEDGITADIGIRGELKTIYHLILIFSTYDIMIELVLPLL